MARHGARIHRPGSGPRRARAVLPLLAVLLPPAIAAAAGPVPDTIRIAPADSARTAATVDSARAALAPFLLIPIATVVERGSGPGQAQEPSGLAVDAFSHLLVADAALHRVQWLDAQGRFRSEAGSLGSGTGELRAPVGLAPLGSTGWALLDRENHRVLAYDLFGRLTGVLVDLDSDDLRNRLGRVDAIAMASDRGGALMLADADRDRLLVFDFSGSFVRTLGGFGDGPGSFRGLSGVAITPRGEVVTAERSGARVQRLDSGGQPRASWTLPVAAGRGLLPVAVSDSERIAVGDERGGTVRVYDDKGRLQAELGGLQGPRALAFSPDGTLLVAEAAAGRVVRYRLAPVAEGAAPQRR